MDGQERSRESNPPTSAGDGRSTIEPEEFHSPRGSTSSRQTVQRHDRTGSQVPLTPQRPAQAFASGPSHGVGPSSATGRLQRLPENQTAPAAPASYQLPPMRHQHHRSEGNFAPPTQTPSGYAQQGFISYSPSMRQQAAGPTLYYQASPNRPVGSQSTVQPTYYGYGSSSRQAGPSAGPFPPRPTQQSPYGQPPTPVIYQGRPFSPPSGHSRHQSLGAYMTSPTTAPGSVRTPETAQFLQHYGSPGFERRPPGPSSLSMSTADQAQAVSSTGVPYGASPSQQTPDPSLGYGQRDYIAQARPTAQSSGLHRRYMSADIPGGMPTPSPNRSMHLDPSMFGSVPQPALDADLHKRHRVSRACDECRRKKVRCDATLTPETVQRISPSMSVSAASLAGKVPAQTESGIVVGEVGEEGTCTSCKRLGIFCRFSRVPMKRGPSKGYIKELEDRLVTLESALGRQPSTGGVGTSEGEISHQGLIEAMEAEEQELYGQDMEDPDYAKEQPSYTSYGAASYAKDPYAPQSRSDLPPTLVPLVAQPPRPFSPVVGLGVSIEGLQPEYRPAESKAYQEASTSARPIARARGHSRTRSQPALPSTSAPISYPTPTFTSETGKEMLRSSKRFKRQGPPLTSIEETPLQTPPETDVGALARFRDISLQQTFGIVDDRDLVESHHRSSGPLFQAITSILSASEDTQRMLLSLHSSIEDISVATASWRSRARIEIFEATNVHHEYVFALESISEALQSPDPRALRILEEEVSSLKTMLLIYLDGFQRWQPLSFLSFLLGSIIGRVLGLHLDVLASRMSQQIQIPNNKLVRDLQKIWRSTIVLDCWHGLVFARPSMLANVSVITPPPAATQKEESQKLNLDEALRWTQQSRQVTPGSEIRKDYPEVIQFFTIQELLTLTSMHQEIVGLPTTELADANAGPAIVRILHQARSTTNALRPQITQLDPIFAIPILSLATFATILVAQYRLEMYANREVDLADVNDVINKLVLFYQSLRSMPTTIAQWAAVFVTLLEQHHIALEKGVYVVRSSMRFDQLRSHIIEKGPMGLYSK